MTLNNPFIFYFEDAEGKKDIFSSSIEKINKHNIIQTHIIDLKFEDHKKKIQQLEMFPKINQLFEVYKKPKKRDVDSSFKNAMAVILEMLSNDKIEKEDAKRLLQYIIEIYTQYKIENELNDVIEKRILEKPILRKILIGEKENE